MELIMEIILGIVSIILGTALFWMLNSMFSIIIINNRWNRKAIIRSIKVDNNNWNNISNSRICCK